MVVDRLMAVWIPDFGLPGSIRSEMGEGFEEQVWQALCDRTQIWRPHIRYPTSALTEKFSCYLNKVIEEGFLTYCPFLLGVASFAYDTKVHLDLGQTPFELG